MQLSRCFAEAEWSELLLTPVDLLTLFLYTRHILHFLENSRMIRKNGISLVPAVISDLEEIAKALEIRFDKF